MTTTVRCSVIGATGYTGAELIRILAVHPNVKIEHLTTRGEESIPARNIVPGLAKSQNLVIKKTANKDILRDSDVIFLALPHTMAMETAAELLKEGKVVIDLSADFRLRSIKNFEDWYKAEHTQKKLLSKAVYGLPELNRSEIRKTNLIANPGCYPTGAALGLLPLLKEKLIDLHSIIIDSKSGVSGAGKKLAMTTHFSEVNENFNAYKVNQHQHMPEIEQTLSQAAGDDVKITFVPHLLPITRGIFSTIYTKKHASVKPGKIIEAFEAYYKVEPFVRFLGEGMSPTIKSVAHTNFCDISVQINPKTHQVIVMTTIDNLVKGASGQAVQNMNIRMNFSEEAGLL